MGKYYGVREVEKRGDRLFSGLVLGRIKPVPQDKILVGIMDNGLWRISADLTRESELDCFYKEYMKGNFTGMDLYLVSKEEIEKCPDEGRDYNRDF